MRTTQRAHYLRRLLEERSRARGDLAWAEMELQEGAESLSDPDAHDEMQSSSSRMADELDAAVASRESVQLDEIDDALRTLYDAPERYGVCTVCSRPIAPERLEILPATRVCERHARRARATA